MEEQLWGCLKARKRLDDMGTGFPATQNGIEKILKRLFTEPMPRDFQLVPDA
jgi:hypothetical protein